MGGTPHYLAVSEHLSKAWRSTHEVKFETIGDDFYLFKCKSFEDEQQIPERGPWFVKGFPLFLKRWIEDMFPKGRYGVSSYLGQISTLKRVSYRSAIGLSKIASCIGILICMDKCVVKGFKLAYERVMVEVSVTSTFPKFITIGCK